MIKIDHRKELKKDLDAGFTMAELERLIGLPKNNLSYTLKKGKEFSKKSKLKIEHWMKSDKPNPLTLLPIPKISKEIISNVVNDSLDLGVAIIKVSEEEVLHVDPISDEGEKILDEFAGIKDRIQKINEQLALGHKFTPFAKRKLLEKELAELESKITQK